MEVELDLHYLNKNSYNILNVISSEHLKRRLRKIWKPDESTTQTHKHTHADGTQTRYYTAQNN